MSSKGSYVQVSAAMASTILKYGSVNFVCADREVSDVDIVRALMVQFDLEEIERVHPMPGNYWVVTFTTPELAEDALNGFILKEKAVRLVLVAKCFITADASSVVYAPPDAILGDFERALERYVTCTCGISLGSRTANNVSFSSPGRENCPPFFKLIGTRLLCSSHGAVYPVARTARR